MSEPRLSFRPAPVLLLCAGILAAVLFLRSAPDSAASKEEPSEKGSVSFISAKAFDSLPDGDGDHPFSPEEILWRGVPAPCDLEKETVYLPAASSGVSLREALGEFLYAADSGQNLYIREDAGLDDPAAAIRGGTAFSAAIGTQSSVTRFRIVFTGLPALCIRQSDTGEIIKKEVHSGSICLIPVTEGGPSEDSGGKKETDTDETGEDPDRAEYAEDTGSTADTENIVSLYCTFHVRGNISASFSKKPYRISLTDRTGEQQKTAWLDLREDDDWILNPLYSDSTRVREMTAYSLWEKVTSLSEVPVPSSRMRYVELFLNDRYEGIYGLQEPVDRKQLGLEPGDLLYKIDRWDYEYPYLDLYDEKEIAQETVIENDYGYPCVEIRWPKTWEQTCTWKPMQAFHSFVFRNSDPEALAGAGLKVQTDSVAQTSLFCALTHASDNNWKNSFLVARRTTGGYTLYRTLWDLNYVFGDVFLYDPEIRFTTFDSSSASQYIPAEDSTFDFEAFKEQDPGMEEALRSAWRTWRQNGVRADLLCEQAQEYQDLLIQSGAMEREMDRWPQDRDSGEALSEMQDWIRQRFRFLDEKFR